MIVCKRGFSFTKDSLLLKKKRQFTRCLHSFENSMLGWDGKSTSLTKWVSFRLVYT